MINVEHQLPQFIQTDYPGFVEFLKAYYEWAEKEYGIGYYGDLIDIDTTITSFLQHFRKELDIFGITNDDTSRFYLRHLKELYTAKGSPEAAKFLLKILYDKNSTIRLPWDYTLIASGGDWRVPYSFVTLSLTQEQAESIVGKELTVIDTLGNTYTTMVEYVAMTPGGMYEVYIGKIGYNRLSLEVDTVTYPTGSLTLTPETNVSGVTVIDGGTGFSVGQVFSVVYGSGTGLKCRITAVDSNGKILAVEIVDFGEGYVSDFYYVLTGGLGGVPEVLFYPLIHVLTPTDTLYLRAAADGTLILGDYTIVTADAADLPHYLQTGDGVVYRKGAAENLVVPPLVDETVYYVIRVSATKLKLAETLSDALAGTAIDLEPGATGSGHSLTRLGDGLLRFTTGTTRNYPGYYLGSGSILGDGCFLEDSFYYQVYSYVTIIEETLAKYQSILKTVLHPAGTKHFGEHVIELGSETNEVEIDFEMDPE